MNVRNQEFTHPFLHFGCCEQEKRSVHSAALRFRPSQIRPTANSVVRGGSKKGQHVSGKQACAATRGLLYRVCKMGCHGAFISASAVVMWHINI